MGSRKRNLVGFHVFRRLLLGVLSTTHYIIQHIRTFCQRLACVQTITKLWLVPSAKQRRDPCSGPPTDSTDYRKRVPNSPSTWLAITTNKTKAFLTGQSWRVLKSGYTAGSPEQGFRRCFADGVNQSLISSARRLAKGLMKKRSRSFRPGYASVLRFARVLIQ